MSLFKVIFHDFLDDYESMRSYADGVDFKGEVNPLDGVIYPNISSDIPTAVKSEIIDKLSGFFGREIKNEKMFMRLSKHDDKPPHAAHNDVIMGQYTFMLYLTRPEFCMGGTSFVKHNELDMSKGLKFNYEQQVWEADTNDRSKWQIIDSVSMESNKALMFNSEFMHWAESPYGYGDSAYDGRLLLICFFDLL